MEGRDAKLKEVPARTDTPPYSSRIIKAGAILPEAKTLLSQWDVSATSAANLDRILRDNLLGKASRSRVEDIIAIFRQRYLQEPTVARSLVVLVKGRLPSQVLDRILYFHAARSDRLIHDVVTDVLVPLRARGITEVDPGEIRRALLAWSREGKLGGDWSESTMARVTQGLLSTLRDFGILQGAVRKRFAPAYLPVEAFSYVAFFLKQLQPSGARLVELPDWGLFLLDREGVERFLFEAHQLGLLDYHAAGSVTRLNFPSSTLEDYAHALAERAH
jgi:hypothetical protein